MAAPVVEPEETVTVELNRKDLLNLFFGVKPPPIASDCTRLKRSVIGHQEYLPEAEWIPEKLELMSLDHLMAMYAELVWTKEAKQEMGNKPQLVLVSAAPQ